MNHPGLDVLLAHVDGELPHDETSEVARHIEACASCRDVVAGAGATSVAFAGVLAELDGVEPAAWAVTPAVVGPVTAHPGGAQTGARDRVQANPGDGVLPLRSRRRPAYGAVARRNGLRWAAGVLLVSGAAVSAAILTDRLTSAPPATAGPATTDAVAAAAEPNVAMVTIEPVDGRVRVSLTGVGGGSTVHVLLAADQAASVAVEGAESPHFTATAGHVQLDLRSAAAAVRLSLPYGLRAATVTLDGLTIIRVDADVVTPRAALDGGLSLDDAAEVRPE